MRNPQLLSASNAAQPPFFDCMASSHLSARAWQAKESQIEESHNGDLDYPPTNRKKRDSRLASSSRAGCKRYPRLHEALADYMTVPGYLRIYPSARIVVDVADAADGASEDEVITYLSGICAKARICCVPI